MRTFGFLCHPSCNRTKSRVSRALSGAGTREEATPGDQAGTAGKCARHPVRTASPPVDPAFGVWSGSLGICCFFDCRGGISGKIWRGQGKDLHEPRGTPSSVGPSFRTSMPSPRTPSTPCAPGPHGSPPPRPLLGAPPPAHTAPASVSPAAHKLFSPDNQTEAFSITANNGEIIWLFIIHL